MNIEPTQPGKREPLPRSEGLPLRHSQELRLIADELCLTRAVEPVAFNVTFAFHLAGALDVNALEFALGQLVQRHAAFRIKIRATDLSPANRANELLRFGATGAWQADMYTQDIVAGAELHLQKRALNIVGEDVAAGVAAAARGDASMPFDCADPPLLRAMLFKLGLEEHALVLVMPHIICDDWTISICESEIMALYASALGAPHKSLTTPVASCVEHAYWERQRIERGEMDRHIRYWVQQWLSCRQRLASGAELPFRRDLGSVAGAGVLRTETAQLGSHLSGRLRTLVRTLRMTPYVLLRTCVGIVLQQQIGRSLPLWSNFANRGLPETQDMVGWLANRHVVDCECSLERSGVETLQAVNRAVREAARCQDVPLQAVWNAIGRRLHIGRTDVRIAVEYVASRKDHRVADLCIGRMSMGRLACTRNNVDVLLIDEGQQFGLRVRYAGGAYSREGVRRFLQDVQACLMALITDPDRSVSKYGRRDGRSQDLA